MMKLLLLAATAAVASADDYECCNDDYSPAGPYENPDRDMEENDRSYDYSHQTDEQIAFMAVFAECMGADSYADDFEAQCNGLNNGGCSIQDFDTPLQHAYFVNHEDPYMQGEADRFKKGAQQHCLANDWVERSSKIAWSYDKYVAKIHVCQNSKTQQECEDACCKFYDGGNDAYDDGTCSHLSHHGLTHDDHDDCGWKGQEQPAADKAAADKAAADKAAADKAAADKAAADKAAADKSAADDNSADDYGAAGPYENPDRDMEDNDRSYDYTHRTDEQIAFFALFAECSGGDQDAEDFEAECNGLNNGGCSIQDFDTPLQHAYFVDHEDPYMNKAADQYKKGAQQHCLPNDWVERSSKIAWSYDKYVAKIHVCQNLETRNLNNDGVDLTQECEDACCKLYDDGSCYVLSHHGLTHDDHDDCGWKGQEQPAADKAAADKAAAAVTTTTKIELSLDMDVNLDELDAKETQALEDGVVDGLVATGACEKEDVKTVTLSQDKTRRARRAENAPVKAEIVFKPDTVDPTEVETAVTTAINSGSFKVEAEINGETISATITEAPVVESATKKKGKKGASSEDQVWTPWCWTGGVDGCGGEAGAGADGAVTTVVSVTQLVVATALAVGVML